MANYKNIIPFILKWEGGLSKSKLDTASKYPVPDGSGYHTNKGVTWEAWQKFAPALGYTKMSDSLKAFYKMNPNDWGVIFKSGYWDAIKGDEIRSQGLADMLVDWAWASGPNTAIKKLQDFAKIPVSYKMDARTLDTINNLSNPTQFLSDFADYKKKWMLSLPNQQANYKGWENRQNDLKKFVLAGGVGLGLILLLTISFIIFKNN